MTPALRKQERKMLTNWKTKKVQPITPEEQARRYAEWIRENHPELTSVHVFPGKEYAALSDFTQIPIDNAADYK